jgi:uncharacterized membrane protein
MSREHIHLPANLGEEIADKVAEGMGSWRFVIAQTIILFVWATLNSVAWWVWKWDAYPFIAMNLLLSCQAAYAAPLILMSSNRAAARDKKRDDLESEEVQSLFDNHLLLLKINKQQLEILDLLKTNETDTHEALGMLLESAGWKPKEEVAKQ